MAARKPKDDNAPKTGGKRAALKALSRAKRKAHYAAQFDRTESNRRRRMQRHLRANPFDEAAARRYEVDQGRADTLGVNARGKKLVARREREILLAARAQG